MENLLYITLDQDLIRLGNQLNSIDNLIDIDKFKAYGRYAHIYDRHYKNYDKKRSRIIARKTINNALKTVKSINKKIKNADSETLKRALKLIMRTTELQMLFM
jgi:hypothetical protein